MRRLKYLAAAQRDLVEILTFITQQSGSLDTGRRFVARLRGQCRRLAELPGTLGRARPELRQDIRSFPCQGYLIFFRYQDDALEIISILEGHRDIENHFLR